MDELKGYFVGYKAFKSKKDKQCYVISLLFMTSEENKVTYFVKDIFTDEKHYNEFLNNYEILNLVVVKREVVGDTVRYYI